MFLFGAVLLFMTGCFRIDGDLQAMRNSVMNSVKPRCSEKIEIGVGPLTLGLAKGGLRFVDLDPEARVAVRAVKGAQVGVYEFTEKPNSAERARALTAADEVMSQRGWERAVCVLDRNETVAVYLPAEISSVNRLRVCVLVIDEREMVIAAARGNPEPLIELALKEAGWEPRTKETGWLAEL